MDTLLRQIPKVDDLLRLPALNTLAAEVGAAAVTEAVRQTLDRLRADILVILSAIRNIRKDPLFFPCSLSEHF